MTYSICLIVKDEAENIERVLNSVALLAAEIIIVDTGSTDNTKELASKFNNVKIFDFAWTGRFDEARNYALSKCTKDVILVMDADEELTNFEPFDENFDVGFITVLNKENDVLVENKELRYFRNHIGVKYSNPMHENVAMSIQDKRQYISGIRVQHYGYADIVNNEENRLKKLKSHVEMLRNFTPEDFSDQSYNFILSNLYEALGDEYNFLKFSLFTLYDRISNQAKAVKCIRLAVHYLSKDMDLSLFYLALSLSLEPRQVQARSILFEYLININNYQSAQEQLNLIKTYNSKSFLINDIIMSEEQILLKQNEITNGSNIR